MSLAWFGATKAVGGKVRSELVALGVGAGGMMSGGRFLAQAVAECVVSECSIARE